jgi:cyclic pyranopterin monophosphate synthase
VIKGAEVDKESEKPKLSHTDADGEAHMVDVSSKPVTARVAEAEGFVSMSKATLELVRDNSAAKGDVLGVARVAGIMAAKKTADLIPLCHGLPVDHLDLTFELDERDTTIKIHSVARTEARTGIEMEAMTAVAVAGLTIYDMLKAVDRAMVIGGIRVTLKSGGRSGLYRATPTRTP